MHGGGGCRVRELQPRTLTLRTEAGEECLMRISEQAAKQIAKVISEFNRSRDFLFAEDQIAASATLQ
jgi:hypothetical protein